MRYADIAPAQELLDIGKDLRHCDNYRGLYFAVVDKKHCVSAINVEIYRVSLNAPISLLWTDDPTYANYLAATSDTLWEQSVPASEQIEKLQHQGPPKA